MVEWLSLWWGRGVAYRIWCGALTDEGIDEPMGEYEPNPPQTHRLSSTITRL